MRTCGIMVAFLVLPALGLGEDRKLDVKPLSPDAAAKKIDETCTVQMEVKSAVQ